MTIPWHSHFKGKRAHRFKPDLSSPFTLPDQVLHPLIRSLQKFQLGESGEGATLRAHARATGDSLYAEAIAHFIQEEQDHSGWMAGVLAALEAPLLTRDWTQWVFVRFRRALGLKEELLVLLVAEMIAMVYFRALRTVLEHHKLKALFGEILQDEEGHVQFHIDRLSRMYEGHPVLVRGAVRLAWRILFRGTCLVVWWDHGGLLKRLGLGGVEFWWQTGLVFDRVAAELFLAGHSRTPLAAPHPAAPFPAG